MTARYKKTVVKLRSKNVAIYASPKISHALKMIDEMSLYEGVKMIQLIESVYEQGKKDGAKSVFDAFEHKVKEVQKAIPHRNPGQPRKNK